LLADCIDIVQDYLSELGDRIDSNDLRRRKTVANAIWNRLSEEIEKPHGRCPMCGDIRELLLLFEFRTR
jgi:hypothetical protein